MVWYNPLTWFLPDTEKQAADLAESAYNNLMSARGDLAEGRITQEQYNYLQSLYVNTYGAVPDTPDAARSQGIAKIDAIINARTAAAIEHPLDVYTEDEDPAHPGIVSTAQQAIHDTADALGELAKSFKTTAAMLTWLGPAVLIGAVAIFAWPHVARSYAKAKRAAK